MQFLCEFLCDANIMGLYGRASASMVHNKQICMMQCVAACSIHNTRSCVHACVYVNMYVFVCLHACAFMCTCKHVSCACVAITGACTSLSCESAYKHECF
jgi:hypothetical protein